MDKEMKIVFWGATLVLLVPALFGVGIVVVGSIINGIEVQHPEEAGKVPPIVTLAEFEQVQPGMSYREAVDIIGDPGISEEPPSDAEAGEAGAGTVGHRLYVWKNSDASNMKAIFRDGGLLKKSQLFLK